MARIRSVHPGLFTDEAFMEASPLTRLLVIGLWTEAWDDGVFEWKPIVLKARIFPVDACDVSAMLAELCALNVIKMIERGGRKYGLIRNFCKYQRPKKPNCSGVSSEIDDEYVGRVPARFGTGSSIDGDEVGEDAEKSDLEAALKPEPTSVQCGHQLKNNERGSPPVRNRYGTGGENPPQMEDGGWRMEEEGGDTYPLPHQQQYGDSERRARTGADPVRGAERQKAEPVTTGADPADDERRTTDPTQTGTDPAGDGVVKGDRGAIEARLRAAAGLPGRGGARIKGLEAILTLLDGGDFDLDLDVLPVVRAHPPTPERPVRSWAFYATICREERAAKAARRAGNCVAATLEDDLERAREAVRRLKEARDAG